MGYNIQYGTTSISTRIKRVRGTKKMRRLECLIAGCALLLMILFGRFGLLDFLIPGDNDVTKAAFSDMIQDVQEGESVKRAVTAFCNEILNSANYGQ